MSPERKKQLLVALVSLGLGSGITAAIEEQECAAYIVSGDEQVCITAEIQELLDSELKANNGFGGTRYGES